MVFIRISGHRVAAFIAIVLLFVIGACSSNDQSDDDSSGDVKMVVTALSANDVTSATVTVTGPGITTPNVVPLVMSGVQWAGTIGGIPAGLDRTFTLSARDATGVEIYSGVATGVAISPGQVAAIVINAQQVASPVPRNNAAPVIDALVVSAVTVAPSEVVSLAVTAHDPNPGDTLTYGWSADSGTFSSPSLATTTWTAPASSGTVRLTIDVRDQKNARAKMSVDIAVVSGQGRGKASITVGLNTWPVINDVTADPTRIDAGNVVTLDVAATDSDTDALSYTWSGDCVGTFSAANVKSPSFTLTNVPASKACTFTVAVQDGKGGSNTGNITIAAGPGPIADLPPEVVSTYQSVESAAGGQNVTLRVQAIDPNGTALTFAWTATLGGLNAPTTVGGMSEVQWTAPATFAASAEIRVTITDATAQAIVQTFTVQPTVATGTFAMTGALTTARAVHQAILLPSGNVLVAGGDGGALDWSQAQSSVELYNPTTGTFSVAGSLVTGRAAFTVTRLLNGKFLFAAGNIGQRPFGSEAYAQPAELYDPATGTFSATGSLGRGRYGHTATLLQDGRVLIVGGYYVTGTAELYNPSTGTFSFTGSLGTARFAHTATLLPNGKVLVVGGEVFSGDSTATTELYDPTTGTFSPGSSLVSGRFGHTMTTLPDGRVVVAGGRSGAGAIFASIEIYDPVAGVFAAAGSLNIGRHNHTATLLPNGQILVASGTDITGTNFVTGAELYNPANGTSTTVGALTVGRSSNTATLLNDGSVLFVGGWGGSNFLTSAERYY